VSWVSKLFRRDRHQVARLQNARTQRDEAAQELEEVRSIVARNRNHEINNHFGERIAAAFAANDRREGHA
jgi:hypothetical protein